jgi:general secretion pathway protein G
MLKQRLRLAHERLAVFIRAEQGVTLLEVLIVIMIMGFIATLGSIQLIKYFSRARVDSAKLQMNELSVALDLFRIDLGRYPNESEGLRVLLKAPDGLPGWRGPYLKRDAILQDPWGRQYRYAVAKTTAGFQLSTLGSDGQVGGEGDNADIIVSNE